jgi:hypothetical protein
MWAQRRMAQENRLTTIDAQRIEEESEASGSLWLLLHQKMQAPL